VQSEGADIGATQATGASSPGQAFFITEPHDLITPENPLGPSDNFPGSLSGMDSAQSPFPDHGTLEFCHRR